MERPVAGPNSEQNDVDMYYGKGLISKKLYTKVGFADAPLLYTTPDCHVKRGTPTQMA